MNPSRIPFRALTNPNGSKFQARLKRSQAFFGLHFDFHASEKTNRIGSRTFARDLKELLRKVRPDYLQCDCKGHGGFSSYPTAVGYQAPGIVKDTLKVWRRLTDQYGVSLYMHFSGVWDNQAVRHHPSWGRRDEKGRLDGKNTSVFGPYVDKHLLPQLEELRKMYHVDGFWIDGECWATCQDYGKQVRDAFQRETGISKLPTRPDDPHFFEFTEFCREGFRRYLRHYIDVIHARCPGVEVASNWAFSSFMPEPVSANVDFLSGDYTLVDSVNSARLEARCLMHQGKPWDLMSWSFSSVWEDSCRTSKSHLQLQREAALVISLGGGFQMYFTQRADGSFKAHEIPVMEAVARFCRERQPWSQSITSIPQVAILHSSHAHYRKSKRLFSPWDGELHAMQGILNALLHQQTPTDIVCEHHLTCDMERFPLIIVPEWEQLEPFFRKRLLAYARKGGGLLLVGCGPVRMFRRELGLKIVRTSNTGSRWLTSEGFLAGIHGPGLEISPKKGTRVLARWHEANDPSSPSHPAATVRKFGKGKIAALALDFGKQYREKSTFQAREIFGRLVRELFPRPLVEVSGSHEVDVTLMGQQNDLLIHMINTSGPHDNPKWYTHDEINPIGPLTIRLRLPRRPKKAFLQPGGLSLPLIWEKGGARIELQQLDLHSVIVIPGVLLN